MPGPALDTAGPLKSRHPFADAEKAQTTPRVVGSSIRLRIEPDTVIRDGDLQRVSVTIETDMAGGSVGVTGDIGERLLHDPVRRRLVLRGEPRIGPPLAELHRQLVPLSV